MPLRIALAVTLGLLDALEDLCESTLGALDRLTGGRS